MHYQYTMDPPSEFLAFVLTSFLSKCFLLSCGQGLEVLLYACVQGHKFPLNYFIQAPFFKKTNFGIN